MTNHGSAVESYQYDFLLKMCKSSVTSVLNPLIFIVFRIWIRLKRYGSTVVNVWEVLTGNLREAFSLLDVSVSTGDPLLRRSHKHVANIDYTCSLSDRNF